MRGLDEIRKINNDPRAARLEDALFAGTGYRDDAEARRFHGTRVEARQRERTYADVLSDDRATGRPTKEEIGFHILADLALAAIVEALVSEPTRREPEVQDRIHSAIDAQPPLFRFWQKLNDALTAAGKPEAGYGQAREAFNGGKTPVGAITFVGKEWDGIRAVPAEPVKHLGGNRPAYHGEYREVTGEGTVWHKVKNVDLKPIVYKLPEAALVAAKECKTTAVDAAFH